MASKFYKVQFEGKTSRYERLEDAQKRAAFIFNMHGIVVSITGGPSK